MTNSNNNIKITVFGGTNNKNYTEKEISACQKLGKYMGSIQAHVLTGACGGFPFFVGESAILNGARVFGFTPATNIKEHIDVYGFPLQGVSDMVYAKQRTNPQTGEAVEVSQSESFMLRSIEMTPFSDVVIALGGSWGTFFELLLSFFYHKTIILIEEFEGAVKAFHNAYEYFGKRDTNPKVHLGSKIIRVKNVDAAIDELENIVQTRANNN